MPLFGEKTLMIDCRPTRSFELWRYAVLNYLVGGVRIGNDDECTLNAALPKFERLLRGAKERTDQELYIMSAEAVFSRAWNELYGDDAKDVGAWERYGRLVALPLIDTFDPWKAFLIESGSEARFIWKDTRRAQNAVSEVRLDAGELDDVVARAVDWLRDYLAAPPEPPSM